MESITPTTKLQSEDQLRRYVFRNSGLEPAETQDTWGTSALHNAVAINNGYGKQCGVQVLDIKNSGGAGSLALTLLRQNSLITGNITGNLPDF
jgi:hypothetical protein